MDGWMDRDECGKYFTESLEFAKFSKNMQVQFKIHA